LVGPLPPVYLYVVHRPAYATIDKDHEAALTDK
jgi:hypothetical protein